MKLSSLFVLLALTVGCAPVAPAPSTPPPPAPRDAQRMYRLDFALSSADGAGAPTTTSFTMNLLEHDGGEITFDKPRQDFGMKVKASLRNVGSDLYLETQLDLTALEPPTTMRKIAGRSEVLVREGAPAIVASLDDDKKHYQLTVTPTKLR